MQRGFNGSSQQASDSSNHFRHNNEGTNVLQRKILEPLSLRLPEINPPELNTPLTLLRQVLPDADLSSIQESVFAYAWYGQTYKEIAKQSGYDPDYLKDVGHKLWKQLSQLTGESISKNNFCSILKRRHQELHAQELSPSFPRVLKFPQDSHQAVARDEPYSDLGEMPSVPIFYGRDDSLSTVEKWTVQENNRLIGIFGLGGIGKTALAAKFIDVFSHSFQCVIWRSLRDQPNFNHFLAGLIQYLAHEEVILPETPHEQVSLLIQYLNRHRCLIVIDDWSAILNSETLAGRYQESYENYGLLLRRLGECQHQSTVFIVSREKPGGVAFRDNLGFPVRSLYLRELDQDASQKALTSFGVTDIANTTDKLLEQYGGNPFYLRVIAKTIVDLFNGDVTHFSTQSHLIYGDIRGLIQQQFERLTALERLIVASIAHSPNPISIQGLQNTLNENDEHQNLLENLESLYHRGFLIKIGSDFSLPNLFRAYASTVPLD